MLERCCRNSKRVLLCFRRGFQIGPKNQGFKSLLWVQYSHLLVSCFHYWDQCLRFQGPSRVNWKNQFCMSDLHLSRPDRHQAKSPGLELYPQVVLFVSKLRDRTETFHFCFCRRLKRPKNLAFSSSPKFADSTAGCGNTIMPRLAYPILSFSRRSQQETLSKCCLWAF